MNELTEQEMIYYANYALIELCDVCGDYFSIRNYHDDENYIEYNGQQFLCNVCKN